MPPTPTNSTKSIKMQIIRILLKHLIPQTVLALRGSGAFNLVPRISEIDPAEPRRSGAPGPWLGQPHKTKYMTLGAKFCIFSVLSPRMRLCFISPYFLAGIAAFFEILLLAVSKHDLKPSGTFF